MAGTILTLLGVAVTFAAGVGYAGDTLRGRVQPNRVTWFVSGVTAWIACAGQVVQGVVLGAVLTFAVAVVPTLIVAASLANRDAYWQTTRLDVVCLALAGTAVLVLLTSSGDLAIAMGITARCLGGVPTVVKAWRAPRTEQTTVYAAGVFGAVCTLVAAPDMDVPDGRVRPLLLGVLQRHDRARRHGRAAERCEQIRGHGVGERDGVVRGDVEHEVAATPGRRDRLRGDDPRAPLEDALPEGPADHALALQGDGAAAQTADAGDEVPGGQRVPEPAVAVDGQPEAGSSTSDVTPAPAHHGSTNQAPATSAAAGSYRAGESTAERGPRMATERGPGHLGLVGAQGGRGHPMRLRAGSRGSEGAAPALLEAGRQSPGLRAATGPQQQRLGDLGSAEPLVRHRERPLREQAVPHPQRSVGLAGEPVAVPAFGEQHDRADDGDGEQRRAGHGRSRPRAVPWRRCARRRRRRRRRAGPRRPRPAG